MFVSDLGALQKLDLPEDFELQEDKRGGSGDNWRLIYKPKGDETVRIVCFYRGVAEDVDDSRTFRQILSAGNNVYISPGKADPEVLSVLLKLERVLGNAGDNQFSRQFTELTGSYFKLSTCRVMTAGGRQVMMLAGEFINYKDEIDYYYQGVFYDGTPGDKTARVEEIFLQAETEEGFLAHKKAFETSLASAQWTHAATRAKK